MSIKVYLPVIGMVVLSLMACNTDGKKPESSDSLAVAHNNSVTLGWGFSTKEYKKQTALKYDFYPEVSISIPFAEGTDSVAKKVNKAVFNTIQHVLGEEGKTFSNYDALLANYIRLSDKIAADASDGRAIGWTGIVKGKVMVKTANIINVFIESYTMTGGAHGNTVCVSLVFDAKTGDELSIKDIIKDIPAFTTLAEQKFREVFKLTKNANINATGLMFPDDTFVLPANVYFTDKGLVLFYNTYEIAAYVEGSKKLELPYSEIADYLKIRP